MTPEEIRTRFEDPSSFRWVPLGALRAGEFLSCVDGRHEEYVIAGPGGDVGEVLVLLAVIESIEQKALASERIFACVQALMDWHPRFYMHTDAATVTALEERLDADARFRPSVRAVGGIDALLQRPPRELREPLADYLLQPDFTGCGHLSCLLRAPQRYGIRLELARDVLRSFFYRMWDGSPAAQFVVLEGVHREQAVLTIAVEGEPDSGLFVPAVLQSGRMPMVFVQHAPAREYLRKSFLDVLEHHGLVTNHPDALVLQRCARLADEQLDATLEVLAGGLPRFTVHFGESRAPICVPAPPRP